MIVKISMMYQFSYLTKSAWCSTPQELFAYLKSMANRLNYKNYKSIKICTVLQNLYRQKCVVNR